MDFSEPEHLGMIRDSVRKMLEKAAPLEKVAEWDRTDSFPRENLRRLAELGVCALAVSEDYGGIGPDIFGVAVVIEELSRRSTSFAGLYIQNAIYGSMNIHAAGTEEQKARLLPQLAAGELIFAYGLSEPNVGADLTAVETRAERSGDTVVINGAKRWCSGADIADYIYALVRSGPAEEIRNNLSLVLIPKDVLGTSITKTATMGLRGIQTCDVRFEDVEIPFSNVIGGENGWTNGWKLLAGPALEAEKIQVPAMAVGMAEAAIEEAWNYSQGRRQFGVPICVHQTVRHALVDAKTQLQACRLMLQYAIWLIAEGKPSAAETSMAKLHVAEAAREIILSCQCILGAYGYAEGFQMERLVRDVLVLPIWGGSSAIQRNNIANLLRLPKA